VLLLAFSASLEIPIAGAQLRQSGWCAAVHRARSAAMITKRARGLLKFIPVPETRIS
jgi:hypothetical protein